MIYLLMADKEKELLRQLRESVESSFPSHPFCTDACLFRYLRARNWDHDASLAMLTATLQWRALYKPEDITLEDIEEEAATGKMYMSPFRDKQDRPIIVMRPGLDTTKDKVAKVKYLVWIVEEAIRQMINGIEKMSLLVDFSGVGMALAGIDNTKVSIEVLNILQNHYPERLGVTLICNPPWVFSAFWKVIKPLLDPVTQAKIVFVANKKKDCAIVLERIDSDSLEIDFGGQSPWKYDHAVWKENFVPFSPPADPEAQ